MSKHHMTTPNVESFRDALTTIRRCWNKPDMPKGTGSSVKGSAGSVAPGGRPTVVRASVVETLHHWTHAALDAEVFALPRDANVDAADPMSTSAVLLREAVPLMAWSDHEELLAAVIDEANGIEELTREVQTGVIVGQCPHELVMPDGLREVCGGSVRVTERSASDVKCPRCGRKDTVEQWRRWIVAEGGLVPIERLCEMLANTGVRRLTPNAVRIMVSRKVIPGPADIEGRQLYNVEAIAKRLLKIDRAA